jgi:hypothetical protein
MRIADFLSKAIPNWAKNTPRSNKHYLSTTNEVFARLNKDWEADVLRSTRVYEHILHMADALSDGIVKQVPSRFS